MAGPSSEGKSDEVKALRCITVCELHLKATCAVPRENPLPQPGGSYLTSLSGGCGLVGSSHPQEGPRGRGACTRSAGCHARDRRYRHPSLPRDPGLCASVWPCAHGGEALWIPAGVTAADFVSQDGIPSVFTVLEG